MSSSIAPVVIALFLVLIVSILVALFFLGGFLWSARSGQFDDQQGTAIRMLFDNDEPEIHSGAPPKP